MKKFLLTVTAVFILAASSVFGMYGADNTWLFFLIHGNQLRARMNQVGFTLGNGTVKGTFGFKANTGLTGQIFTTKGNKNLEATVSGGIGYTGDGFGVGVGYNYTYNNAAGGNVDAHTPVFVFNAVNNNLRVAVPVSISSKADLNNGKTDYFGLSIPAQIRYYTGIDAFNYIRFEFNYGKNSYKEGTVNYSAKNLSFQLRLHFLNTVIENVTVNPFLRVDFASALDAKGKTAIVGTLGGSYTSDIKAWTVAGAAEATAGQEAYDRNPYDLRILPSISLTVNTDIVNFIFEPGIGYRVEDYGKKGGKLEHSVYWSAYGEVYVRPIPALEWYFEMDVNNGVPKLQDQSTTLPIAFGANSGITWYLPSLNK